MITMCGGNKVKERANALAQYQQRNRRSSNDFSDIRDPTLRARMQASAQYLGNRSSGRSGRSSRTTRGRSGSRQTRTQSANRTKRTGIIQRARNAVRRVAGNIRNRSSNTIRIPSNRQSRAGARRARQQQQGTVQTRRTVRQGARSGFTSQFRR